MLPRFVGSPSLDDAHGAQAGNWHRWIGSLPVDILPMANSMEHAIVADDVVAYSILTDANPPLTGLDALQLSSSEGVWHAPYPCASEFFEYPPSCRHRLVCTPPWTAVSSSGTRGRFVQPWCPVDRAGLRANPPRHFFSSSLDDTHGSEAGDHLGKPGVVDNGHHLGYVLIRVWHLLG